MAGCKIFDAFKTNSAGVWYFIPKSGAFQKGKPCKGFGCVKYAEGSVYTGDLFYDGKNFNKLGYGQQDFSHSAIGNLIPAIGEKKYKFVGAYDYRKTDWIYGNGVLYFTDPEGRPTHFRKGFYRGLDWIGGYRGEFDNGLLLDGYTPDMEFDFDENEHRLDERWAQIRSAVKGAERVRVLFLGDSYFELFDNPDFAGENLFCDLFPKDCVNIGVSGSKFSDWIGWADKMEDFPAPDKIVINLGFNDLHGEKSAKAVFSDFKKLVGILRGYFPQAKIYLVCAVHAPNCANQLEKECEYNGLVKANAEKCGVTAGEWNGLIRDSGENCFHADAVHPNERGYGLFAGFLKAFIDP